MRFLLLLLQVLLKAQIVQQHGDLAYAVRCLAARYQHPIEVLGVFDTVKATLENKIDVSAAPDYVNHVFHAMAIDEYRWDFNITRFTPRKNLQEVWFTGCHSDVGGYYVEGDLSYITLNWMVGLSTKQGLLVDRSLLPSASDTYSSMPVIHNEKKNWWWRALDWVRGKANFRREIPALDLIHSTVGVFRSLDYNPGYLPNNMIVWNNRTQDDNIAMPFILTTTEIYRKIRNFNLSIVPQGSMLPVVVPKYVEKVILEPLHNCIAHQDYNMQERIVLTEYDDYVEMENAGTISFDVFATLLARACGKPQDVFAAIERETGRIGFAKARIAAERRSNRKVARTGCGETSLEEIYSFIPRYADLCECEVAFERETLKANPEMVALWDEAGRLVPTMNLRVYKKMHYQWDGSDNVGRK